MPTILPTANTPPHAASALPHSSACATPTLVSEVVNVPPSAPHRDGSAQPAPFVPVKSALDFSGATTRGTAAGGSIPAVLVDHAGQTWRVKASPHGDYPAAVEVMMAKVFALTGLHCPQLELVHGCPLPGGGVLEHWNHYQIASHYDPAYQDLGAFLHSDVATRYALCSNDYAQARDRHNAAIEAQRSIVERAGPWWSLSGADASAHAAADRQRFAALEDMNRLLPAVLRADQLRHYIASVWLGNWDHLNVFMENFGYTQRATGLVGSTVDFGTCGPLGYQGYPKATSHDVARQQRPASLFSPPARFSAEGARFNDFAQAVGCLGDVYQWPYGYQSASVAELLATQPEVALEMGYRLQCIETDAMRCIVDDLWTPPGLQATHDWPTADALVAALDPRRQQLIDGIGRDRIAAWSTGTDAIIGTLNQLQAEGRAEFAPG